MPDSTTTRKLFAISMPKTTHKMIEEYCTERDARIAEVIETMLMYWITNPNAAIDRDIYDQTPHMGGRRGAGVSSNFRVKLHSWIVQGYNQKRTAKKLGDTHGLPFGPSIGCLWLDWWVNESEKFTPTPRPSNVGKRYKRTEG